MSEGHERTSNNHANILIKLCVHPNIISKSIKSDRYSTSVPKTIEVVINIESTRTVVNFY